MNIETLSAFRDEVEKLAVPAALIRAGRFLSESPVRGALVGAGAGALGGAAASGEGNRIEGALHGAVGGAALGGAAAGAGRAYRDTHLLNDGKALSTGAAVTETARRLGAGAKRFVKRQVHGVTGAYADPAETGIRSTVTANRNIDLAQRRLTDRLKDVKDPGQASKMRASLGKEVEGIKADGEAGDRALKAGITSLPGVVRGLASGSRRKETLSHLGHAVTGGKLMSLGGAMGVGAPLAFGAHDISRGDESASGGKTLGQKVMNVGTNVGVGALTAGLPLAAGMVVGSAADSVGQRLVSPKWRRSPHSAVGLPPVDASGAPA